MAGGFLMEVAKVAARALGMCRWPVDEARIADEAPGRAPSRVFRALETALCANDMKTVGEIIKERPEALAELNQYGCAPLMMAISKNAVELLLPFSNPDAADDDGGTALGYMAGMGAVEAIRELLPHANPLKADGYGVTPLMSAAREGAHKAVELLVGVSDLRAVDVSGRTALMFAAISNCEESVKMLLDAEAADGLDKNGMDALMLAARSSKFEYGSKNPGSKIVRMLLEGGDQARLSHEGKSAFEYAVEGADMSEGAKESALLLMDGVGVNVKDGNGRSLIERMAVMLAGKSSRGWWISETERRAISGQTGHGGAGKTRALRV